MNKKIIKVSSGTDMYSAMTRLKGKKIQIVTVSGEQIRGTVHSVGKEFVIINGFRIDNKGARSTQLFPFFFPFSSFLFFAPFFFRRRFFLF